LAAEAALMLVCHLAKSEVLVEEAEWMVVVQRQEHQAKDMQEGLLLVVVAI